MTKSEALKVLLTRTYGMKATAEQKEAHDLCCQLVVELEQDEESEQKYMEDAGIADEPVATPEQKKPYLSLEAIDVAIRELPEAEKVAITQQLKAALSKK